MSTTVWLWAASIAGAVLFFLAGKLLPRRGAAANVTPGPTPALAAEARAEALAAEVEGQRALLTELRAAQAAAQDRLAAISKDGDRREAERRALQQQVEAATAESGQLLSRLAEVQSELRSAAETARRTVALAEAARGEAERAKGAGEAQRDSAQRGAAAAAAERDEARRALGAAAAERDEARRALGAAVAERDRAQRAMATTEGDRAALRAGRAAEMDALRATHRAEIEAQRARAVEEIAREAEAARVGALDLSQAREQIARMRADLDAAHDAAADRARELAEARHELARIAPVLDERADLVARFEVLKEASAEVHRLRDERAELAARLDEAERELAARPAQKDLDDLRLELGFQRDLARTQHAELAGSRAEKAALGAAAAEVDVIRRRVTELSEEVAALRAAGYLARSHRVAVPHFEAALQATTPQAFVEQLAASSPQVRSAVIADVVGLVVASYGELGDTLGAYGTFLADAASRAAEILPVGEVTEVRLRGHNDVTVSARRFTATTSARYVLATLEVVPERREDQEARKLTHAASSLPI